MKKQWIYIFAVTFFYFAVCAYFKTGFWDDELAVLADAINSKNILALLNELKYEVHAPGYWLLIYILQKLGFSSEFVLRLPSVLMGSLGLVAFSEIARNYFKRPLWVYIFILICATLPSITWHATEARPHIFLFAAGSWCIYFLHQASLQSEDPLFYKYIKRALLAFTAGLVFHYGMFFMGLSFLGPFVFFYRKKLRSIFLYLRKFIFLIAPVLFFLFLDAVYLFHRNIESVLWGKIDTVWVLLAYTSQSFVAIRNLFFVSPVVWAFIVYSLSQHKKTHLLSLPLKFLLTSYFWSLLLILLLELAGIPFGKAQYSLYNLPLATLFFVLSLQSWLPANKKVRKLLTAAVTAASLGLVIYNLTAEKFVPLAKAREMFSTASDFLQANADNRLIIFGNYRNLTYYIERFNVPSEKTTKCYNEDCFKAALQQNMAENKKTLVLFYKNDHQDLLLQNLKTQVLVTDDVGLLVKIESNNHF